MHRSDAGNGNSAAVYQLWRNVADYKHGGSWIGVERDGAKPEEIILKENENRGCKKQCFLQPLYGINDKVFQNFLHTDAIPAGFPGFVVRQC